jgi:uncharacterized ParB-like nuclease family protein
MVSHVAFRGCHPAETIAEFARRHLSTKWRNSAAQAVRMLGASAALMLPIVAVDRLTRL